ncbi:alpha/beta hydrolase [Nocardia noduli]|uniref:alpha/beta hydrolase n=1 Tax=Nocardia noduli TaxID=2815722 RepID=UPI001C21FF84|nr:alpha/beta hydrolase [Nocardia noduli]
MRNTQNSSSWNPVHTLLDLDENGDYVDPVTGRPVRANTIESFLADQLDISADTTDIVVFVHGWRNTASKAAAAGHRLQASVEATFHQQSNLYPAIGSWSTQYVTVRWPSSSNPFLSGYRRIRDRAHEMTTAGRAAQMLAQLLGYLDATRHRPGSPVTLRGAGGQYLHCVGHSFGGRFLVEAVQAAADSRPTTLGWNRPNPQYPYTVDTLLVFQMAAPPDIFAARFSRLLGDAPINGPIVLTHSTADRATGMWHRIAEGTPGIGYSGARGTAEQVRSIRLHKSGDPYSHEDFDARIVNVDATWRYSRGRYQRPEGAHSDIWHPESTHLLLSLASLAR